MRVPFVFSPISLLLAGVLGISLALPQVVRAVECGQGFLSAGTIVLDKDLVCSNPDQDFYAVGLEILGDTTLDLNGHTISCTGGLRRAIRLIGGARLRNGTIADCLVGLQIDGDETVVEQIVFTRNEQGVIVEGGSRNMFRDNVAVDNVHGFVLTLGDDDSGSNDNVLVNNIATQNTGTGFVIGRGGRRNSIIGNTASFNATGFVLNSAEISVRGNIAELNRGPGFKVLGGYGEMTGNTARQNGDAGFIIDGRPYAYGIPLRVQENIARNNSGDGFLLPATFAVQRLLQRNLALNNGGHGIHVEGDGKAKSRILSNTAIGHLAPFFDLADDSLRCRSTIWRRNIFDTASQVCIR